MDPQVVPQPIKMCFKTLLIPSVEEMRNYVSVITWEMGLDDATDDVMAYATEAVRVSPGWETLLHSRAVSQN